MSTGPGERLLTLLDAAPISSYGCTNEARLQEHRPESRKDRPDQRETKTQGDRILPPDPAYEENAADEQKSCAKH